MNLNRNGIADAIGLKGAFESAPSSVVEAKSVTSISIGIANIQIQNGVSTPAKGRYLITSFQAQAHFSS